MLRSDEGIATESPWRMAFLGIAHGSLIRVKAANRSTAAPFCGGPSHGCGGAIIELSNPHFGESEPFGYQEKFNLIAVNKRANNALGPKG